MLVMAPGQASMMKLSNGCQELAQHQLIGTWAGVVVNLESLSQERLGILAGMLWNCGCRLASANFEDSLELAAVGVWMCSCHHLDNKAAQGPDIGLSGI